MRINELEKMPVQPKPDPEENNKIYEKIPDFKAEEIMYEENIEMGKTSLEEPEKKRRWSNAAKAIRAVTAGVVLFGATMMTMPAFAQESNKEIRKQRIEEQIKQLENEKLELEKKHNEIKNQERRAELTGYLAYFNANLKLGEPGNRMRCPCEQYGIYDSSNQLLGDVRSSKFEFTKDEFMQKVSNLVKRPVETGKFVKMKKEEINFKIDLRSEAKKILNKWGGSIDENIINIGRKEISLDEKTKSVTITGVNDNMLIITIVDFDGKKTVATCEDGDLKNISEFK